MAVVGIFPQGCSDETMPLTDSGSIFMVPMVHTKLTFLKLEDSHPEQGRVWNKAGSPLTNTTSMLALTLLHSERISAVLIFEDGAVETAPLSLNRNQWQGQPTII